MNQRDIERHCKDFGVPCHMVGERLRVMDLTQLPGHMRSKFDDRGFYVEEPESTEVVEEEGTAEAVAVEEPANEALALRGKLPEDFPGHTALEAAGLTTYAKVRKSLDTLEELDGIGTVTAEKIRAAMGESSEADEEQE